MSTKVIGKNCAPKGDNPASPQPAAERSSPPLLAPSRARCNVKAEWKQRFLFFIFFSSIAAEILWQPPPGKAPAAPVLTASQHWESSAGVRGTLPTAPWPCATQVIGCSGLFRANYNLSTEYFLWYRCTNWSRCLLQAQADRLSPELFGDFIDS